MTLSPLNKNEMKPLFTVHAGEYLVGEYLERSYPKWHVWVPSRDTGIDLLVTNEKNRKAVSLQVKFSKDFNPADQSPIHQNRLLAAGWWVLDEKKIQKSNADYWVFVLPSFIEKKTSFIILPPGELLRRLRAIHGSRRKPTHSYLRVTRSGKCWETRGLAKGEHDLVAFDQYSHANRDFSKFLNAWSLIENDLK